MKLFEYYGAKTHLSWDIIRLIAPHLRKLSCIVDVFGGSGAVILNLPLEWNIQRVYNDSDKWLYDTFKVIQDDQKRQQLLDRLEMSFRHRDIFYEYRKEYWEGGGLIESEIDIAFRIIYLYQYGFNGSLTSYGINISDATREGDKMAASIKGIKHFAGQLRRKFTIENLDFEPLIKKWDSPTTLFYLDPPYMTGGNHYRASKKERKFGMEEWNRLAALMKSMDGYYILNESDKDIEALRPMIGDPQFGKVYANQITRNFKGITTGQRTEYYWHNLDRQPPAPQEALKALPDINQQSL